MSRLEVLNIVDLSGHKDRIDLQPAHAVVDHMIEAQRPAHFRSLFDPVLVLLQGRLRPMLKEPLVHFLLAGFAVFLLAAWRGETVDLASRTITIAPAQVEQLVAGWTQTWRRPPSDDELDGLIRDYVEEEVYYREAIRLGLDKDDPVVRRRLRSKMEYLATSEAETTPADDSVLQKWLQDHSDQYATEIKFSFDQIYFDATDQLAANAKLKAAQMRLASGSDWRELGEKISLPASPEATSSADVARLFGDDFATALSKVDRNRWVGPIQSGFGLHLVRLRSKTKTKPPQLSEVRQRVENDWRAATKTTREAQAYQALLDGYSVKIEKP